MIHSLKGNFHNLKPFSVILECSGVGYFVNISLPLYDHLNSCDAKEVVFVYTRTIYSENNVTMYGFLNAIEANIFDYLRKLQGIGAKNSLNLLSTCGADGLYKALIEENIEAITKTPGIGPGRAKKIIFEAEQKKDKLKTLFFDSSQNDSTIKVNDNQIESSIHEGLMNIGFHYKEIKSAQEKIGRSDLKTPDLKKETIQEWIKLYLKYL